MLKESEVDLAEIIVIFWRCNARQSKLSYKTQKNISIFHR